MLFSKNKCDEFLIVQNDDGVAITEYLGRDKKIIFIPKKILGKEITAISEGAFCHLKILRAVFIPGGIRKIGENAFFGCEKLKRIVFLKRNSFIKIERGAFDYCGNLKKVYLNKNTVKEAIRNGAFLGCYSLIIH